MFNRILAPLDGSSLAECILPHLVTLSAAYDAQIILAHVLDCPAGTDHDPIDLLDWEMSRAKAESYLESVSMQLLDAGVSKVTTVKLEGQPAQCVVDYMLTNEIDLVVLSSHGRSGLSRWNISSVVRKVIQRVHNSMMIVRAYHTTAFESPLKIQYKRIFVPLDGSQRAECALAAAITIARSNTARLLLGHVVERPDLPSQMMQSKEDQALIEQFVARGEELGSTYLGQLADQLSVPFEAILRVSDDITATLHNMVAEQEIDLVVLCAHGTTGKTKWPFGSKTTSFIEYGTTPLLIYQDLEPEDVEPTAAEKAAKESQGY